MIDKTKTTKDARDLASTIMSLVDRYGDFGEYEVDFAARLIMKYARKTLKDRPCKKKLKPLQKA